MSKGKIAKVQRAVIRWFAANQRDLPWRHTRDPYRILVSEVMLQQTQVDRVIPKYRTFLRQFPTVQTLARATPREVILSWAGMGYNRRALYLHAMAHRVVERFEGRVPTDPAQLLALPGVGPYTAAAVATFSTGRPYPLADTNVRRVIGRVFLGKTLQRGSVEERKRGGKGSHAAEEHQLLRMIERTMPRDAVDGTDPSLWGHAVMDFGALVCRSTPRCDDCPVQQWCRAYPYFSSLRGVERPAFAKATAGRRSNPITGAPTRGIASARVRGPRNDRGSLPDRLFRGRILRIIRERDPASVPLVVLAKRIPERPRRDVGRLIRGLVTDGLLQWEGKSAVRLPDGRGS